MVYRGGKGKFAQSIVNVLYKNGRGFECFVAPFCGGCNVLSSISGKRIANDIDYYLISLWQALVVDKWQPPPPVSEEFYQLVKQDKSDYEPWMVGWIGFVCSFRGGFFGGLATNGAYSQRHGQFYNNQLIQTNHILKQIPSMLDVGFENQSYSDLDIPHDSLIYCDPPYNGTNGYGGQGDFDSELFWDWARRKTVEGHAVFISEYTAPNDFNAIWTRRHRRGYNRRKDSVEKLFAHRSMGIEKPYHLDYRQAAMSFEET